MTSDGKRETGNNIIPISVPHLRSRKAYRSGVEQLVSAALEDAFDNSLRLRGATRVQIDEALMLFLGAIRRQARRRERAYGISPRR
jgi:hypothetical protein